MSETENSSALIRLPGQPMARTVDFFERHGFRTDMVFPADNPRVTRMSGHGLSLQLDTSCTSAAGSLVVRGPYEDECLVAPNGTHLRFMSCADNDILPPFRPSRTVSRSARDSSWIIGRAGMRYRDLIPDRQGGRYIASHIRIAEPGPVPDFVHYHRVRFQMIYCYRGWARLVYEDQGNPFILRPGDCVLQPPQIRHRVLESGEGLEVVEIGCPAEHETCIDHEMTLPNGANPERVFHGQQFVHCRDPEPPHDQEFGLRPATGGLAEARVVHIDSERVLVNDGEFGLAFVLKGDVKLRFHDGPSITLGRADAVTLGPDEELTATAKSSNVLLVSVRPGI